LHEYFHRVYDKNLTEIVERTMPRLAKGVDAKELGQRGQNNNNNTGILTGRRRTGEDGCLDPNVLLLSQPPKVIQVLSQPATMPRNSALQQPSTAKGSPRHEETANASRLSSFHAKKSSHQTFNNGSPPASIRLPEHFVNISEYPQSS